MKKLILLNVFYILLLSCSKEKIPNALENMTVMGVEGYGVFTGVGDNTIITEDGYFYINSIQGGLLRVELNGYAYGQNLEVFNPPHNEPWKVVNSSMIYNQGDIYYVADDSIFVYASNTTDFVNPKRIIRLGAGEAMRMIDIEGNKLFATNNYFDVFTADLTGIDSAQYDTTVFIANYQSSEPTFGYHLILDYHNGYLFLESERGIDIVDVTDPSNATVIHTLGGGSMAEFRIAGNYLYLVGSQVHGNNLQVYDITNPASPVLLTALPYTGQEMLIIPEKQQLYVQQAEKIRVFDISDPANINKVDVLSINGLFYNNFLGDMDVRGNYLYLTSGVEVTKGVVVFDLP